MIDANTLGFAYALAFSVGACFGVGILAVAAIIHILDPETRLARRVSRRRRRHHWSA